MDKNGLCVAFIAMLIFGVCTVQAGSNQSNSTLLSVNQPHLFVNTLTDVGDAWVTVTLPYTYDQMVVVATPVYSSADLPAVVRIRNAAVNQFEIRLQNPSDTPLQGYSVFYLVMEVGVYNQEEHGVTMEAGRMTSSQTAYAQSWEADPLSPQNEFDTPVVLGQVMSYNDPNWSVFWSKANAVGMPPQPGAYFLGKHVGEDSLTTRADETLGYVIVEEGSHVLDGYEFEAIFGEDAIGGLGSAPSSYEHDIDEPVYALATQAGMDGANGGWVYLWEDSPINESEIQLVIDEDQVQDTERGHTLEEVHALVFSERKRIPAIFSLSPARGVETSTLRIEGFGFSGANAVLFPGDVPAPFNVVSNTEMNVEVPAGAVSGAIRILTADNAVLFSPTDFVVSLAEILPGMNLCRQATAQVRQSSQAYPFAVPEKACDGHVQGTLEQASIASTELEEEAWWEVDLGQIAEIADLVVWNRSDCCQKDLAQFFVFVSSQPFTSTALADVRADPSVESFLVDEVEAFERIAINMSGRYLRLQHTGIGSITLAEVEIIKAGNAATSLEDELGIDAWRVQLDPAYPSPFGGQTTLTYRLTETSAVRLIVFDALGREVALLADHVATRGSHAVRFDGSDLPNGIYYYRLESEFEAQTKSMVLVR